MAARRYKAKKARKKAKRVRRRSKKLTRGQKAWRTRVRRYGRAQAIAMSFGRAKPKAKALRTPRGPRTMSYSDLLKIAERLSSRRPVKRRGKRWKFAAEIKRCAFCGDIGDHDGDGHPYESYEEDLEAEVIERRRVIVAKRSEKFLMKPALAFRGDIHELEHEKEVGL